jgi:hypothetical protein
MRNIVIEGSTTQPSDAVQIAALNAATTQPSSQNKPNASQSSTPGLQSSFELDLKAAAATTQPGITSSP